MAIPDKLYFRIGEVASLCGVPAYVLRFWEGEFPQLKPNKGGSGQRLYRRRDVEVALRIRSLLYEGKFTIPGARQVLKTEQRLREPQLSLAIVESPAESEGPQPPDRKALRRLRMEMRELLEMLSGPAASRSSSRRGSVHSIKRARANRAAGAEVTVSEGLFK
jgi:DNA-binding transcriptional MerR regulator